MVQNDTEWCTESFRVVQSGIEWYRVVQSGMEWYRVAQSGTEWYRVVRSGTESYRVVQSGLMEFVPDEHTLVLPKRRAPLGAAQKVAK